MKSVKAKLSLIIALAFALIASLGAFIGNITARANRYVTLSGLSIFNTSGDAEVWAHKVDNSYTNDADEEVDDPYYYTMFTFENDDDTVSYRRNLAYRWYENAADDDDYLSSEPRKGANGNWWIRRNDTGIKYDSSVTPTVNDAGYWVIGDFETEFKEVSDFVAPQMAEGYFHIEIGFEELNFEKFVITFETQQYHMTEDKKTVNYIIFIPAADEENEGKVYVLVTDEKDVAEADAKDIDVSESVALDMDHIKIAFSDEDHGTYAVKINNVGNTEKVYEDTFKNVGKMYAKYVSSTTNPVTPLSFKADMPEKEEGDTTEVRARMALYEMNGQSFVLNRNAEGVTLNSPSRPINSVDDGDGRVHYTDGQVNDLTPPVLCLDKGISYVTEGNEISFSYTAIDVLTQSPSVETGYFLLAKEQAAEEGFNSNDYTIENLYRVVKDSDDQYIYPHSNHYVPTADNYSDANNFGKGFTPVAAIKVYLKLTDTASTGGQSTYIMLDWFVEEDYKLNINGNDYIAVAKDTEGAHYNGETKEDFKKLIDEYQVEVDKAAENLRAGTDDFYLPSFEKLVSDNTTAYADMTYSIYYMANGSRSSVSSKAASSLSIPLNSAGDYLFTVYAHDSASNKMWYLKTVETKDGEEPAAPEVVEFETSEIWAIYEDEELHGYLPWFTFTAGISEITIEDPGEQDTAYVGTTYTGKAFEIKGISTKATYTLYRFNIDLYAKDHDGNVLTYQKFMETKQELFEGEGRRYFTNITPLSELDKDSEEYEEFGAYAWNASSRSFVPQDENVFYLIKCEVTSTQFPAMQSAKAYMGIAASITPRKIAGEDTWVQDNLISIILLSIAGAALIGIILLLVIKPKDKGDIDEQFEKEVAAKNAKKN